jgi:hypothetical protein
MQSTRETRLRRRYREAGERINELNQAAVNGDEIDPLEMQQWARIALRCLEEAAELGVELEPSSTRH